MQTVISCHFRVVQRCVLWPIPSSYSTVCQLCSWMISIHAYDVLTELRLFFAIQWVSSLVQFLLSSWHGGFELMISCEPAMCLFIVFGFNHIWYMFIVVVLILQASIHWAVHLAIVLHRPTQIVVDVEVTSQTPTEITRMLVVIMQGLTTWKALYVYEFSFRSLCLFFGS